MSNRHAAVAFLAIRMLAWRAFTAEVMPAAAKSMLAPSADRFLYLRATLPALQVPCSSILWLP